LWLVPAKPAPSAEKLLAALAQQVGLSLRQLKEAIEAGTMRGMLFDDRAGMPPLPLPPKRNDAKYKALKGQVITVSEAAEEFDVPRQNFIKWVQKGYIKILAPGGPNLAMELDKADVVFCADVYHWRKEIGLSTGAPLLNDNGEAYQLRFLDVARYRRMKQRNSQDKDND
jgi:hypothetical protein